MPHALATFLSERMTELSLTQAQLSRASGLSTALVSKQVSDSRESITRPRITTMTENPPPAPAVWYYITTDQI